MSAMADTLARLRAEAGEEPPPVKPSAVVGVGWSVYEKAPADGDYWPRGGVVVHIDPHSVVDPESGELRDRYALVRVGRQGLQWTSLCVDELGTVDDGNRPNAHTIRGVCQVVARELAATKRKPDDRKALELWSLGARLMAVLGAPGSVAP